MRHQFPCTDQSQEKKEEGLRGCWVDVSQSLLIVDYWETMYNINRFDLQECGKVSAENTKYAEHYISYGYSFSIYGKFSLFERDTTRSPVERMCGKNRLGCWLGNPKNKVELV